MVIRRNENCEIIFDKYFSKNAPKGAFFFLKSSHKKSLRISSEAKHK